MASWVFTQYAGSAVVPTAALLEFLRSEMQVWGRLQACGYPVGCVRAPVPPRLSGRGPTRPACRSLCLQESVGAGGGGGPEQFQVAFPPVPLPNMPAVPGGYGADDGDENMPFDHQPGLLRRVGSAGGMQVSPPKRGGQALGAQHHAAQQQQQQQQLYMQQAQQAQQQQAQQQAHLAAQQAHAPGCFFPGG